MRPKKPFTCFLKCSCAKFVWLNLWISDFKLNGNSFRIIPGSLDGGAYGNEFVYDLELG